MPAKAPIYLKQNTGKNGVAGGKNGKKLREILSTEMISPPLGDFRHMAHVGRGGDDDMFGDTMFLQQKASSNNGSQQQGAGIPTFHSFRRKGPGKGSKKQRNGSVPDHSAEGTPIFTETQNGYGPAQSPILQSAFTLPGPNQESGVTPTTPVQDDSNDKTTVNNNTIPVKNETNHITSTPEARLNGPAKPRRLTNDEKPLTNGHVGSNSPNGFTKPTPNPTQEKNPASYISDTTSIDESWSLELDLGTSLMDDVIGIMDKIEL